jgi:hypothetical protein
LGPIQSLENLPRGIVRMLAKLGPLTVTMLSTNRQPVQPTSCITSVASTSCSWIAPGGTSLSLRCAGALRASPTAIAKRQQRLTVALSTDPRWRSLTQPHLLTFVRTGHRALVLEGDRTSLVAVVDLFVRDCPKS